jgi:transcriptional regulator with PAS, ATPase and Fis domain
VGAAADAAAAAPGGAGAEASVPRPAGPPAAAPQSLSVEENEKHLLREALLKARGNRTKAAQLMGVSRRTLHRKIAQWPELDVIDR